jgi:general secretion pathway protein G
LTIGRTLKNCRGLTLIEMLITMVILAILAAAVMPMAEMTVRRTKEIELRRSLRLVRTAIDAYKADFELAKKDKKIISSINETGYPKELDDLIKGESWGDLYEYERKYLRRIPTDPFDEYDEGWGLRAYADDHDSQSYGGNDIYDIYSQSEETALDGTYYNTW